MSDTDYEPEKDRANYKLNIWDHFTIINEEKKIAKCSHCDDELPYDDRKSNLYRHLMRNHITSLESETEDEIEQDISKIHSDLEGKDTEHEIWKYFNIVDTREKIAQCRFCLRRLKYLHRSNLIKHFKLKHRGEIAEQTEPEQTEDEGDDSLISSRRLTSNLWLYFTKKNRRVAVCGICQKPISYISTITNLRRHLTRKHNVSMEALKKENNEVFYHLDENIINTEDYNQNGNEEINPVYLDEYVDKIKSNQNKRRKSRTEMPKRIKTEKLDYHVSKSDASSSEENGDTLSLFGKYIVSLLRVVPNQVAVKLQADFVKQTMNAILNSSVGHEEAVIIETGSETCVEEKTVK